MRLVAGALVALPATPAMATCPGWRACGDGLLWDVLLPGMILAGLAIWVAGPFLLAVFRAFLNRR